MKGQTGLHALTLQPGLGLASPCGRMSGSGRGDMNCGVRCWFWRFRKSAARGRNGLERLMFFVC